MITFFTNPRPFSGQFDRIQRNAISSWKATCPGCQIILFEDEDGTTSKAAQDLGVEFIAERKTSEFGTPMLNDSFLKVKAAAKFDIIVQISADIILTDTFLPAVKKVYEKMQGKPFFIGGRRTNLDFEEVIDFSKKDWQTTLMEKVKKNGSLFRPSAMDYWVLTKNLPFEFPAFAIGRIGTDSWLVYKLRSQRIPVIDATNVITIIHQNHPYPRKREESFSIEEQRNIALAGGLLNLMTLREANFLLTKEGLQKPPFPRNIFTDLALFYPWRLLVLAKRTINKLKKR